MKEKFAAIQVREASESVAFGGVFIIIGFVLASIR